MADSLEVGDVVQLKSGGPRMTVSEVKSSDKIGCVWFEGDDKKASYFPSETLEKVEAGPQLR